MLLSIQHETRLTYSEPVAETVFELRMAPPSDDDQTNLGYRLRTWPAAPVTSYRDGFGNQVDLFNRRAPYRALVVRATTIARTHRRIGDVRLAEVPWQPRCPGAGVGIDVCEFLGPSPLVGRSAALDAFVAALPRPSGSLLSVVQSVVDAVRHGLRYEPRATTARTPLDEVLALGRGVCQDHAHLFLGACRALGLPARYVSGYVHAPGARATHAWCQVWADRSGWIDVDPTHGNFLDDNYVATAFGRDYADVPPNRGVWKGLAEETIRVAVKTAALERVPADWTEWAERSPRDGDSWTGKAQRPRRLRGPRERLGYRQQQGQQQQ
jgi:transglutaminase-like putative cysteine protease